MFLRQTAMMMMSGGRKRHPKVKFSEDEDVELKKLVQEIGTEDWHRVSSRMPGRNMRQCKERWLNYLRPDVGNGPWTVEEDQFLLLKVQEWGFAWRNIAALFDSRTDINVKSRWHLIQRRIRKEGRLRARQQLTVDIPSMPAVTFELTDDLQNNNWDWTDETDTECSLQNG
jgi:hypothetical protein